MEKRIVIGLAVLLAISSVHAHDPGNRSNDSWLNDLATTNGGICCNGDDVVIGPDWEFRDGRYRVMLGGDWQVVPESAVIDPRKNRDGVARVWPIKSIHKLMVRCFLPGAQT